jgi:hypothetical protein
VVIILAQCLAIAKSTGNQCKQVSVNNGLCSAHAAMLANGKEVPMVNFTDVVEKNHSPKRRQPKKQPKVAQPEFGPEHLESLINETTKGPAQSADGTTKLAFVNGQWAEVPVEDKEEGPVQVAREYFEKQQQANAQQVGPLGITGEVVIPAEIFAKYDYLVKYVAMDAVTNKDLFAAYVVKVAGMTYLQAGLEFKFIKSQEDEKSAVSKRMTEEAHTEYGNHIPLDIRMDIEAAVAEVTEYKNKKAVVIAAIEWYEAQIPDEPDVEPEPDKPAFEDAVKAFFGRMLDKFKGVGTKVVVLAVLLLSLLSIVNMFNIGQDESVPTPKVHHTAPVQESSKPVEKDKPAVDVPVPTVTDKPVDSTPASTDDVVQPETPAQVQVDTAVIRSGDTLWDIAVAVYGDGSQWPRIYEANKDLLMHDDARNATDAGHWIHVGQVLNVPGDAE